MQKKFDLTVHLLFDDIKLVRDFSGIFRKIGVIPEYFESLSAWAEVVETKTPDLILADVSKLSDGKRSLLTHPVVRSEKTALAFFHRPGLGPLIKTVSDTFNFGVISQGSDYVVHVKALLERVNRFRLMKHENASLKIKMENDSQRTLTLHTQNARLMEKENFIVKLHQIAERLEEIDDADFINVIGNWLESWDDIERFSYLELSRGLKQLVSPEITLSKFAKVPPLWPGRSCENGIEGFTRKMAFQVVSDFIGEDVIALEIRGAKSNPEAMLFLKLRHPMMDDFEWALLELILSGRYVRKVMEGDVTLKETSKTVLSPWHLLSLMDASWAKGKASTQTLVDVSFGQLFAFIGRHDAHKFNYRAFIDDVTRETAKKCKVPFRMGLASTTRLAFLSETADGPELLRFLKEFFNGFAYWKYFDDLDAAMTEILNPVVRMVPVSSEAYLRYMNGVKSKIATTPNFMRNEETTLEV